MGDNPQSNERNTVFYLRNLLQLERGYDENIWNLIAGKIQRDRYNFHGMLQFPLFEQIRLVENFVNEVKSVYRSFEREYNSFCENCQGYDAPIFHEYVRAHLSERSAKKAKPKQRLNPVSDNTVSCQPV
jgi:hypothetical protein